MNYSSKPRNADMTRYAIEETLTSPFVPGNPSIPGGPPGPLSPLSPAQDTVFFSSGTHMLCENVNGHEFFDSRCNLVVRVSYRIPQRIEPKKCLKEKNVRVFEPITSF